MTVSEGIQNVKIAICGLIKSQNLGEEFIAKSLAWIIKEVAKEKGYHGTLDFVYVDIQATNDITGEYGNIVQSRVHNLYSYKYYGIPADMLHLKLKKIALKSKSQRFKNNVFKLRHNIWRHSRNLGKRYLKYYNEKFNGVDLIAIDGAGLLEYSYNAYQESLNLITLYGEKHGIPVIFNAIGRAGEFDKSDYRCQVLMESFQRNCVKYVSARDSRESVQECVGEKFDVKLLADAAFCVDEAYGMSANPRSNVIGIGLIRGDASLSYSKGFVQEDWINLFCEIAKELASRGYEYEFFTNGAKEDYQIGLQVVTRLGVGKGKLVDRPTEGKALLNTISSYTGIITCRMHSSIAAFALGIPSVILSWNSKVDKYMSIVGYPHRSVGQKDFNSTTIVEKLEQALTEGISDENRDRMKNLARESVNEYIDLIIQDGSYD